MTKMIRKSIIIYYYFFSVWEIGANEDQVLFNHRLMAEQCRTAMLGVSYTQCLSHFRSNNTNANGMVYKRRFSLCYTYIISGPPDYNKEPGSILAHGSIIGKFDFVSKL